MKRLVEYLPLAVLGIASYIIIASIIESRKEEPGGKVETSQKGTLAEEVPVTDDYSRPDYDLVQEVFEQPEAWDQLVVTNTSMLASKTEGHPETTTPVNRFKNSALNPPSSDDQINASSAYFDEFESLRKDTVRSPDSAENEAAVRSIMRKRNLRVNQFSTD